MCNVKKAAVFFGTGYEEIEALTVVDLLRRTDIEVTCVATVSYTHLTLPTTPYV